MVLKQTGERAAHNVHARRPIIIAHSRLAFWIWSASQPANLRPTAERTQNATSELLWCVQNRNATVQNPHGRSLGCKICNHIETAASDVFPIFG
jgi:hypothetical protein